ncbi:MAG: SSU ribosomal protein S13p (S18e), partial [uncultured Rubrobacteraceae bacterium]
LPGHPASPRAPGARAAHQDQRPPAQGSEAVHRREEEEV